MSNASAFELNALDASIKELVAYARERGGEDRSLLFRNLIDLFLTGKAPQKQPTRQQLIDVVEALIPHVDEDNRRTVAELVAQMSSPPLDLAVCLARDKPDVVGPLLKSQVFDEDDIIDIIAHTGRDHHQAIASRNDLSANVWIALARAAPKAAARQQKSSLSLWSDDLGTERKPHPQKATVTQLHPDHQSAEKALDHLASWDLPEMPVPDRMPDRMPDRLSDSVPHSMQDRAPVSASGNAGERTAQQEDLVAEAATENKQRQAASLRILRTDKDLISERIENANPHTADHIATGHHSSDLVMQSGLASDGHTSDTATQNEPSHSTAPPQTTVKGSSAANTTDLTDGHHHSGWSWQSDRDGIVTSISQSYRRHFPHASTPLGSSILDMLSLNKKLEHPVSRAFQRRSAIHGAPIVFENTGSCSSCWTLDAKPKFSPDSGIFEGYHGQLTAVQTHEKDMFDVNTATTEASAVFIDDQDTMSSRASQYQSLTDENIDRTCTPAPAAEKTSITQGTSATGTHGADTLFAETAAHAVKGVLAETLSSMLQSAEAEAEEEAATETAAPSDESAPTSEIAATLQLLEQAIKKLAATKSSGSTAPARLQAEIAAACLRSLKEQLDIKPD